MVKNNNGNRYIKYRSYERTLHRPYDYKNKGLLNHIMSHKIYNTKNPILQKVLLMYQDSLVFCMQYVDILKHYFDYHWKNR